MATVVQKFGGSSVSDAAKIRLVAERVKARRETGDRLVVVVSAMGDTTDELLKLAKSISADPPRRELDMLLTCGERISMALLSMALHELGVPAISFTGSQSGIITTEAHSQARIIEVRPVRILESLEQNRVVIVAGYQGVSAQREVTTLGRGGSDTTAVALAAALGADCEIYSDVDGVFSADPRVVPSAQKLAELSYDEMQELAAAGAKVLNAQAVEFAKLSGIAIMARSTHGGGTGTRVHAVVSKSSRVRGVTADANLAVLTYQGHHLEQLLDLLDARGVGGRILAFDAMGEDGYLAVPLQDLHGLEALIAALKAKFHDAVKFDQDLGTVTCVGTGINADWGPLRKALGVAHHLGVRVEAVHTSPLQLSLVVPRAGLNMLSRALHEALIG
jgi:aspartate kinase